MKILFLSTNSFPHNKRETLLSSKIQFLSLKFDHIFILTATPKGNEEISIPKNVTSYFIDTDLTIFDKLRALLGVFKSTFLKEIVELNKLKKQMTFKRLKVALIALHISNRYLKKVRLIVEQQSFSTNISFYFHSYWCAEFPICFPTLKNSFPKGHFSSRFHAYDLYEERHTPIYLPFRKQIYSVCDKLFFISEQGKEYFKTKYKIENESKLIVNYLGVAKPNFVNLSNMNSADSKNELVLVSCSSMIALKRIDLIIDSLSQIKDVNICWYHFGDGELKEELVEYARQNLSELNNINYFFQGHVSNAYINEFYRLNKVDLFINVSKYEGVPISIMEAMSYGIPCIGTNVGGVKEIITIENGFLLDVNFKTNILSKIIVEFAHKSKIERVKFIENSIIVFEDRFSQNKNYQSFISSIFELN